jgi:hypothetical protein
LKPGKKRISTAKLLIVVVIVGAVIFGGYVGYLAFANESFPVEQRPFSDYATMASPPQFNGTEISFHVRWLNSDYIPVKAQINSDTTDAANSPACYLDLPSVSEGQVIAMPFGLSSATPVITNVQLSIDVSTVATGHDFTIVYTVNSTSAAQGDVTPTNVSCYESAGVM